LHVMGIVEESKSRPTKPRFDWGACTHPKIQAANLAGVSCVYWKGVLVRDLLRLCGLKQPSDGKIWYLHYEGADAPSE
jgi:hypothetical protein